MPRRNHKKERKQVRHAPSVASTNDEQNQRQQAPQVKGTDKKRKGAK